MSDTKRLLSSSLIYLLSQVLSFSVSLISFPILTRMLTVSEYGILSLCNTTLLLGGAVAKFGMQNSIVRFYAEFRKKGDLDTFYSTFWWGGLFVISLISLLSVPVYLFFAPVGYRKLVLALVLAVFVLSLHSNVSNFLRSEERNVANAVQGTVTRYLYTFGGIALLYFFHSGIAGIFFAQAVATFLATCWFLREYRRRFRISVRKVSRDLLGKAASYGVPLIAFEASSVALAFSDRYLITNFCGVEQLGIYTAGYTICFYIADILRQPLQLSVIPIYLRIYTEKGAEESARFIEESLGYVLLIIVPVFFGSAAIKDDLIQLLASPKYVQAAAIIPWVLGGTLLYACQPLVAAGFHIRKKTKTFSLILLFGLAVNIALNVMLIPSFGIIAAAWSTAISYAAIIIVMVIVSKKALPISFPFRKLALSSSSSMLMYWMIIHLKESTLVLKVMFGGLLYCLLIMVFDRQLFAQLHMFIVSRIKRRRLASE